MLFNFKAPILPVFLLRTTRRRVPGIWAGPDSSESWSLASGILQEQRRAFPRRSLEEFGPFSPVIYYFQHFLVDG